MVEHEFTLTAAELELRRRANIAFEAYDPSKPLTYMGPRGLRLPSRVEQLTDSVFGKYSDKVSRFPNDDGSVIFEQLMPGNCLGKQRSIRRGIVAGEAGARVLNHIRFSNAFVDFSLDRSNDTLISEPDGQLRVVRYPDGDFSRLSFVATRQLVQNLVEITNQEALVAIDA